MKKRHRLPFEILFEDEDILVIDKPAGMLTTHTNVQGRAARESQVTAENLLTDYVRKGQARSSKRVWLVHRLDRETSGVMMFAKSEKVAEFFRNDWRNLTEKTYLARVSGEIPADKGDMRSYLLEDPDGYKVRTVRPSSADGRMADGRVAKFAQTNWRKLSVSRGTTLVEVKLETGRKNQIRVHFSETGNPIVSDEKYGGPKARRMYLHAVELKINLPRYPKPFRSEIGWT